MNAAGMWAPRVAEMVGAFIPSTPVDHQHVALRAVAGHELPDDMPCFRDPDNLVYGKAEHGGMLFGGYEAEPHARWLDGVPWEHAATSLPPDWVRFQPLMDGRDPALPVPGRRRGGPPRLPPRRHDARREPAHRPDARRARVLGRRRAVAQWLRWRRRHRAGDRGLDHGGRSRCRHRAVSGVAVRGHVPRRRVHLGPRSRDVRRLLPASVPVRRGRGGPAAPAVAAQLAPRGRGRRVRHEGRLGASGPASTRAAVDARRAGSRGSAAGRGPTGSSGWGRSTGRSGNGSGSST